ncbi:hypothetical protein LMH87_001915 [Akanthomyces muscarius]|uniref:Uncharacterized protein n=1 Tax=Akanthomyces muscarius TaxID=2231603 RepID=A0A9W8Q6P6_AKAMU|nr:hypothetical protein LMH87_001915 [Akanthomyces muscarius]KAJ4147394.1 hypothetical protein LMH87_001915 [Akanthomyces muscarius]
MLAIRSGHACPAPCGWPRRHLHTLVGLASPSIYYLPDSRKHRQSPSRKGSRSPPLGKTLNRDAFPSPETQKTNKLCRSYPSLKASMGRPALALSVWHNKNRTLTITSPDEAVLATQFILQVSIFVDGITVVSHWCASSACVARIWIPSAAYSPV